MKVMRWCENYRGISVEVISIIYVILFAFTGITKLMEGDRFFNNLNNSPILPDIIEVSYVLSWGFQRWKL